jgi:hypothetical protein
MQTQNLLSNIIIKVINFCNKNIDTINIIDETLIN